MTIVILSETNVILSETKNLISTYGYKVSI